MGFSRQEYWSGLPFPSPGDLPDPGIEPRSPTLQAEALTSEPPGKPITMRKKKFNYLSKVTKPVSSKFAPKARFLVPDSLKIKMRKRMYLRGTGVRHWPRPHGPGPHRALPEDRAPAVSPPGLLSTACLRGTVLAYQAMLPSLFWQETWTGLKDLRGVRLFGGYERSKDGLGATGRGGRRFEEWVAQGLGSSTREGPEDPGWRPPGRRVVRTSPQGEAGWVRWPQ